MGKAVKRMRVYLNGRILPVRQARISPLDAGFLLGVGVFETMRAYGGEVFRLEAHLDRLADGCRRLGIGPVPEHAVLRAAVIATLRANELAEARVRLTVTAGDESVPGAGERLPRSLPTVVVMAFPLPSAVARPVAWTAVTCSRPVFSGDPLLTVKTTSRVGHVLARREAQAAGCDEALLVNERGFYTEGSVSSLFVVGSGVLCIPPVADGLLPGLARETVRALAADFGLKVWEQSIRIEDLRSGAEVFLTNAVIGLVPLVALDGDPVGGGTPGPVTGALRSAYAELVIRETPSHGNLP